VNSPRSSALRVVGRYAIYDKIAQGGMATVHVGRLLGPVGFARTVAIKCMRSELAEDPDFVTMFMDEARVAARIHHPNVVPVVDVVSQAGELFLVMEYIQGESLARLLRAASERGASMPCEIAVTLMAGVLHGLHAAHGARGERGEPLGIVHRDVSPQNVLCGVDGVARVVDFGVAKAAGRVQTTRDGQLKGKIGYMSPEQLHGSVSCATDVYAASVVLWEALAGKRLFLGDSDPEVLRMVMAGKVPPPSAVASHLPRALDPKFARAVRALDPIVLRGLSVDPAKRYATAFEMARALEDTMPPVATSKIGEWVRDAAKDVLTQRAKIVEVVESNSALTAPDPPPPRRSQISLPGPVVANHESTGIVTDDLIQTQLSSGSISVAGRREGPGGRAPRTLGIMAGAGILLAVPLAAALWLHRGSGDSAASRTSQPAALSIAVVSSLSPAPSTAALSSLVAPVPAQPSQPSPEPAVASQSAAPAPASATVSASARRRSLPTSAPRTPANAKPTLYDNM
jgi:serine/threonine-protein kinase